MTFHRWDKPRACTRRPEWVQPIAATGGWKSTWVSRFRMRGRGENAEHIHEWSGACIPLSGGATEILFALSHYVMICIIFTSNSVTSGAFTILFVKHCFSACLRQTERGPPLMFSIYVDDYIMIGNSRIKWHEYLHNNAKNIKVIPDFEPGTGYIPARSRPHFFMAFCTRVGALQSPTHIILEF